MTSHWGPLGWMTLHSASMLYPENPEPAERMLMEYFINLFGETISCFTCKTHFITMKKKYVSWNPGYLNSKKEFMLFVFRAHNTVNKKLDKPILYSVKDCITTLKNANSYSSLDSMRSAYLVYLQNNWNKELSADGFSMRKKIQELFKINNDYFNKRTIDWDYTFEENVLLSIEEKTPVFQTRKKLGGFKNGKLLL
jgi:hypothetical protein